MKIIFTILLTIGCLLIGQAQVLQSITTADQKLLFSEKQLSFSSKKATTNETIVTMDTKKQFQKMEGFGYALTGGAAQLIQSLALSPKAALLKEIFTAQGLGVSYIRISMGASDLDPITFSYNDLPIGEQDSLLKKFSIAADKKYLIPTIKAALAIQPRLKIMASPWSPPTWMKTNENTMGGHLLEKYYASYALYFVKYIQAMKKEGIPIHAITIQNEPEHGGNNPSLLMTAAEQTKFVRDYLGPAFKQNSIQTEIVIYDHNADHPNYPIEILNDPKAKQYIAATAFHLYLGEESALTKVKKAHPNKKIYFTEQWTGAKGTFEGDFLWHMEHIVMGTMLNWSSLVLEWNLAADANFNPHTPGGCTECKGAFTIQDQQVTRNVSYYIIGQVSKYILAGAIRIASSSNNTNIHSIGFTIANNKKALVLLNKGVGQKVTVKEGEKQFEVFLPANSANTFIWK